MAQQYSLCGLRAKDATELAPPPQGPSFSAEKPSAHPFLVRARLSSRLAAGLSLKPHFCCLSAQIVRPLELGIALACPFLVWVTLLSSLV